MSSDIHSPFTFGTPKSGDPNSEFNALRQVILPIIVLHRDGRITPIGSCFVICCTGKDAIAFTAKHNIDYMIKLDGVKPRSDPSAPKIFQMYDFPAEPINIQMYVAFLTPERNFIPVKMVKSWFFQDGIDIAVLLLRIPGEYNQNFQHKIKINSRGPAVGNEVHAYGYTKMQTSEHNVDEVDVVKEQVLSIPLNHIAGRVECCYSFNQHPLVKGPCFQVNKTFDSGMSGGPVVEIIDNDFIACGVISAGSSFEPKGTASKIYPAMLLKVDTNISFFSSQHPDLLECESKGMILDVSKAHEYVQNDGTWKTDD